MSKQWSEEYYKYSIEITFFTCEWSSLEYLFWIWNYFSKCEMLSKMAKKKHYVIIKKKLYFYHKIWTLIVDEIEVDTWYFLQVNYNSFLNNYSNIFQVHIFQNGEEFSITTCMKHFKQMRTILSATQILLNRSEIIFSHSRLSIVLDCSVNIFALSSVTSLWFFKRKWIWG